MYLATTVVCSDSTGKGFLAFGLYGHGPVFLSLVSVWHWCNGIHLNGIIPDLYRRKWEENQALARWIINMSQLLHSVADIPLGLGLVSLCLPETMHYSSFMIGPLLTSVPIISQQWTKTKKNGADACMLGHAVLWNEWLLWRTVQVKLSIAGLIAMLDHIFGRKLFRCFPNPPLGFTSGMDCVYLMGATCRQAYEGWIWPFL